MSFPSVGTSCSGCGVVAGGGLCQSGEIPMPSKSVALVLLAAAGITAPASLAQTFSYQGLIELNGQPVNGTLDLRFGIWDAATGGTRFSNGTINRFDMPVADGLVETDLTFGNPSPWDANEPRWLEIEVRDGDSTGAYVTLPRQPLQAAPFALNTRGIEVDRTGEVVTIKGDDTISSNQAVLRLDSGFGAFANYSAIDLLDRGESKWGIGKSNIDNAFYIGANGSLSTFSILNETELVGIGTSSPSSKLDVRGDVSVRSPNSSDGAVLNLDAGSSGFSGINLFSDTNDGWSIGNNASNDFAIGRRFDIPTLFMKGDTGRIGIGTASPSSALDVNGIVTIRGGADIVEGFESACGTAWDPGTVLSIDPDNPGQLMCSADAYDNKVAGVVSGAGGIQPGIKLGQDGVLDGSIPVAMTGRVYVKASAENGPIRPGDLLTTASIPGHAMRVTDSDRGNGAIIGKAMGELESGEGLVLVLVNLQ